MDYKQIISLKYKIENPVLKKWSMRHGVIDCMTKVRQCLLSGFGYMGGQRVDRDFVNSLSQSDRCIYNGVTAWIDKR